MAKSTSQVQDPPRSPSERPAQGRRESDPNLFAEAFSEPQSAEDPDEGQPQPDPDPQPEPIEDLPQDPAATEPTEDPPADSSPSFIDILRNDGGFENVTEADANARLVAYFQEQREQQERLRQEVDQERQMVAHLMAQARLGQQPGQQPQPEGAQGATQSWRWTPPAINQGLVQKYLDPENPGSLRSDTPAEIRAQADAYRSHIVEWQETLLHDPDALREIIRQEAREMIATDGAAMISEQTERQQAQEFEARFIAENPWMFVADPRTNKPRVGDWSQQGQQLQQIAADFASKGLSQQDSWTTALEVYTARFGSPNAGGGTQLPTSPITQPAQPAPQPQPSPQAIAQQKRNDFLTRGSGVTDRGGAAPQPDTMDPVPKRDPKSSSGEALLERLRATGGI